MDITPPLPASRRQAAHRGLPPAVRSAVTNGKRLFLQRPGDTIFARRFRDLFDQIVIDLETNHDVLSEGQRQLARRAATIAVLCEELELNAASGKDIDLDVYGQLTDRLGRTFHRLGLKRAARERGSELERYLAHKEAAQKGAA